MKRFYCKERKALSAQWSALFPHSVKRNDRLLSEGIGGHFFLPSHQKVELLYWDSVPGFPGCQPLFFHSDFLFLQSVVYYFIMEFRRHRPP